MPISILNLGDNRKYPGETIFNEKGHIVPAWRVEQVLEKHPIEAIVFLESGERFVGALDGISRSSVANFRDMSDKRTWSIEFFYFDGSMYNTESLEFSHFDKHQVESLILFNKGSSVRDMPDDIRALFTKHMWEMYNALYLVGIMRSRLKTAKSVLHYIGLQWDLRAEMRMEERPK